MSYYKIEINKNIENILNENNIFFKKTKERKLRIFKKYFIYVSQELLTGGGYRRIL